MEKDDGLTFTDIDIANLGIEHFHATPRQVVRAIRLRGGDDRVTSRHVHNADAGWREPCQDKTSEGAACPFLPLVLRLSIALG